MSTAYVTGEQQPHGARRAWTDQRRLPSMTAAAAQVSTTPIAQAPLLPTAVKASTPNTTTNQVDIINLRSQLSQAQQMLSQAQRDIAQLQGQLANMRDASQRQGEQSQRLKSIIQKCIQRGGTRYLDNSLLESIRRDAPELVRAIDCTR